MIGLSVFLGILFIAFKLVHIIDWPWFIVLLPLYWWIPVMLILMLVIYVLYKIRANK